MKRLYCLTTAHDVMTDCALVDCGLPGHECQARPRALDGISFLGLISCIRGTTCQECLRVPSVCEGRPHGHFNNRPVSMNVESPEKTVSLPPTHCISPRPLTVLACLGSPVIHAAAAREAAVALDFASRALHARAVDSTTKRLGRRRGRQRLGRLRVARVGLCRRHWPRCLNEADVGAAKLDLFGGM